MTARAERNVAFAESYYKAMNDKDPAGVARHLHSDVKLIAPLASLAGKDMVLEAAKRLMSSIKDIRIRARFGSEGQAMLAYDADFGDPIGICRAAVLMTFNEELIEQIELFFDGRPFGKDF